MGLGKWAINPNFQFAMEERLPFRDIAELAKKCLDE